jgi:hypothetical protein
MESLKFTTPVWRSRARRDNGDRCRQRDLTAVHARCERGRRLRLNDVYRCRRFSSHWRGTVAVGRVSD